MDSLYAAVCRVPWAELGRTGSPPLRGTDFLSDKAITVFHKIVISSHVAVGLNRYGLRNKG